MPAAVRIRLTFKSLQSLTAAALFGRSKWRESREGASKWCWGPQGSLIRVCGVSYRCIFSWRFQWDHRRRCLTSAARDIADFVKSSFGGLRDLWSGCLGCLRMHLFMAVLMTSSATSSDIGGRSYRRFVTAVALFARTCVITLDCTNCIALGWRFVDWPLPIAATRTTTRISNRTGGPRDQKESLGRYQGPGFIQ
jgi:hypothetical protein